MKELPFQKVNIADDFWTPRLDVNKEAALYHQWDQLEKTHCIDNFRIAAGQTEGFRKGYFFSDSDAYKWLDAASRVVAIAPSTKLGELMDAFIDLIDKCQMEDGYVFTFNQIHFPGRRWANFQIEHELYCMGHLIEAAISHFEATGQAGLLTIAEKTAGLLVKDFAEGNSKQTSGHPEIEIALIKLYRATQNESYLALAHQFIHRRGRIKFFGLHLLIQFINHLWHFWQKQRLKKSYVRDHPDYVDSPLPGHPKAVMPRAILLRYVANRWTGKWQQQHLPVKEQNVPEGHSVCFAYLETAGAMLCREQRDYLFVQSLEKAWDHMVTKRMFVTGGIGSLPLIEGFGRDYELNSATAYAETCAALACMYWTWEMSLLQREAKYSDLFEWQLYNAALVGIAQDGKSYLYHNPLSSKGGIARKGWYTIPCCPSNLSRTWASLGKYIYSHEGNELWIHQYVGNDSKIGLKVPVHIALSSELPWNGSVSIRVTPDAPNNFSLNLRIPGWADSYALKVNGALQQQKLASTQSLHAGNTASGFSPYPSHFVRLTRTWKTGDLIELELPMEIKLREPHPKVTSGRGKVALTRGPVVYCVESSDNPGLDIFNMVADRSGLRAEFDETLFNGIWVIKGRTTEGSRFVAIPYYCWANRDPSAMTVMIKG